MEAPTREKIQRLLYETTLARLRFDPEAHKDEHGNWKSPATWSDKAVTMCINEITSFHDKNGKHHLKLKFTSIKSAIKTGKEILKAGRPPDPELQSLYDEIEALVTALPQKG